MFAEISLSDGFYLSHLRDITNEARVCDITPTEKTDFDHSQLFLYLAHFLDFKSRRLGSQPS
jgi:hypothetical protein